MLGSIITKEVVDGSLRFVQKIRYSNGKRVKRLLAKDGITPERILSK